MQNSWHKSEEVGSTVWLHTLKYIYVVCGRKFCIFLLYPISFFFYILCFKQRNASIDYLRRIYAFKNEPKSTLQLYYLSYFHFLEFARAILDKFSSAIGEISQPSATFIGKETLSQLVRKEKKGAFVFGAHIGNIDILRSIGREYDDLRVTPLMFTKHGPAFTKFINSVNPEWYSDVISIDTMDPKLAVTLEERLYQGAIVAMLADRVMPASVDKKVKCNFLGKTAFFPAGPLILASLLQKPVFIVHCFRENNTYKVLFEKFADLIELPRAEREIRIQEYMQKFAERLEHFCSLYPLQWYNFYDFWQE